MSFTKIDLHTHTVASGHAYCSIKEMAKSASEKGLDILGISEHGPAMKGSITDIYFYNISIIPRELYGIKLLIGAELNILDYDGNTDVSERGKKNIDYAIASLHTLCIDPGTKAENTRAIVKAMENPCVNIIGHPDDRRYPLDYEEIARAASETKTLLELNSASLNPNGIRKNCHDLDTEMLKYCEKYGSRVIFGSDAHFDDRIAFFDRQIALVEETSFPEELIVNDKPEVLRSYMLLSGKKPSF